VSRGIGRRGWGQGQLWLLALPPGLYVLAFATLPLCLLLLYSFYRVDFVAIVKEPSLANYAAVLGSATYRGLMLKALGYGVTVAAITAVIAYPFAFFVAKRVRVLKAALLTLMLIPLYTGDLIRIFAWRVVLGAEGVLNSLLLWLGLIEEPIWALLFSPTATLIVLTYDYLPFMVLALWASFEGLDRSYLEAAADLGASRTQTFLRVVLPLTSPGLLAGFLMVLVLVAGDYLTPQLVGGSSGVTVTSAIHDLFGAAFDWPMASALAWVLLAVLALTVAFAVSLFRRSPLGRSLQRSVS
jgi:spermidine/putrescine transport system permease protein